MKMEKVLKSAAKLYQMRETCQRFFKEEWQAKQDEWKPIIHAAMDKHKCTAIEAGMILVKDLEDHGFSQLILWGTITEMIDPTHQLKPS